MTELPDNVLLLRRAPRLDGPYDDERSERTRHVIDGNLALAFPRQPASAMPLRLVPPAGGVDPEGAEDASPIDAIPDPRRLVGPLAQAIAEVLVGARPPQQLADVATLEVLAQLERNAGRLAPRTGGRLPPQGVRIPPRPRVVSLRLCEPRRGALEVAAVIDTGDRRRAMALRLEAARYPGILRTESAPVRWRCAVVRVG